MESVQKAVRKDLGQMLVESKLLTDEQWRQALTLQMKDGARIENILVGQGWVSPQQLAIFTSMRLNVPFVNLKKQQISPEALELIPENIARRFRLIPLDVFDGALMVAMEEPSDIEAIDVLAALTRSRIEPVLAVAQDIQEALDLNYKASGEIEKQLSQIPTSARTRGVLEERVSAADIAQAPIVRAIDLLIRQAVRDRASDIHIEPEEDRVRIRYRIDGILHEMMNLPLSVHAPLLSRVKIMAGLNIAERRRPQDGQITFKIDDREVDIRVATSSTINGEMAVLRILDKTFAFLTLAELGFRAESLDQYQLMLKIPFGMVLISGPTGSGKTTTLYASVNQLDTVGRNVLTIEDPVEYHFASINQMQVNPRAGVTFAGGLRASMRLDPDVILVGEIRDSETAQIAIQAALTGHLVLSSVHANDTVGVLFRLIDLDVERFLVASSVVGVVAQRMVRRVCPHCSRLTSVAPEERLAYEQELRETKEEFVSGSGCSFCAGTGYLGRTGIFEVMVVNEAIRRLILGGAPSDDIRQQAIKEGMTPLWRDGMLKVKMGQTTPGEVIRSVFSIG